jgi:hypothetical protein
MDRKTQQDQAAARFRYDSPSLSSRHLYAHVSTKGGYKSKRGLQAKVCWRPSILLRRLNRQRFAAKMPLLSAEAEKERSAHQLE